MKISEVLIASEDTRIKISGTLLTEEGYCALGALACEKKLISLDMSYNERGNVRYEDIIKAYGVKGDITLTLPDDPNGHKWFLHDLIWQLNDRNYNWSFKKIGEYIKTLEDKGVITYETD